CRPWGPARPTRPWHEAVHRPRSPRASRAPGKTSPAPARSVTRRRNSQLGSGLAGSAGAWTTFTRTVLTPARRRTRKQWRAGRGREGSALVCLPRGVAGGGDAVPAGGVEGADHVPVAQEAEVVGDAHRDAQGPEPVGDGPGLGQVARGGERPAVGDRHPVPG